RDHDDFVSLVHPDLHPYAIEMGINLRLLVVEGLAVEKAGGTVAQAGQRAPDCFMGIIERLQLPIVAVLPAGPGLAVVSLVVVVFTNELPDAPIQLGWLELLAGQDA